MKRSQKDYLFWLSTGGVKRPKSAADGIALVVVALLLLAGAFAIENFAG